MAESENRIKLKYEEPTQLATGRKYTLLVSTRNLLLKLLKFGHTPLQQKECKFEIGGSQKSQTTDSKGVVRFSYVPEEGDGLLNSAEESFPKDMSLELVKELPSVDTPEGQRLRLGALGYLTYEDEESETEATACAIEEFQCDNGLKVDGICGTKTQEALVKQHGC